MTYRIKIIREGEEWGVVALSCDTRKAASFKLFELVALIGVRPGWTYILESESYGEIEVWEELESFAHNVTYP